MPYITGQGEEGSADLTLGASWPERSPGAAAVVQGAEAQDGHRLPATPRLFAGIQHSWRGKDGANPRAQLFRNAHHNLFPSRSQNLSPKALRSRRLPAPRARPGAAAHPGAPPPAPCPCLSLPFLPPSRWVSAALQLSEL